MDYMHNVISFLLESDPAVRWQTMRDIQQRPESEWQPERDRIATTGWGARLLAQQDQEGTWAQALYSRKWISTTYTMMLLKMLGLPERNPAAMRACRILLDKGFYRDGGINYFKSLKQSETCVTGIVLSILAYFGMEDARLNSLAEYLFHEQMPDGGWNCEAYRGATHSSFHTTINALEGLREWEKRRGSVNNDAMTSRERAVEFLLQHSLFKSHRTGEIVDDSMLQFVFPWGWRYTILRALDFMRETCVSHDRRMDDALRLIEQKRNPDGTWNARAQIAGKHFFAMETAGKPGVWPTLMCSRILNAYLA